MKLGVVIVNYRTPRLVEDCLRSVEAERASVEAMGGLRVVVVDNGSGDGSSERIAEAIARASWGAWCELVALDENLGFAGGNNRGIAALDGCRYVLLLNSDTLVHAGCLSHCLGVMDGDESIGVLSALVLNADGTPQNVTRKFPTPWRATFESLGLPWKSRKLFGWADTDDPSWDRRTTRRDVDWVGAAFLLVTRRVLDRVGPLDEAFFFYGEDIEFCHRVWRAGRRVHYAPGPAVTHLGGGSSDTARLPDERRARYGWQARYLVQRKCFGRPAEWWLRAVDLSIWSLRLLWRRLTGRRDVKTQLARQNVRILLRPLFTQPSGKAT